MKICIVGCGAIGGIFAAHLARAGEAEVFAYDVLKEHMRAIAARGLRISGAAEFTARFRATSDVREIPPFVFGIVATKRPHTRKAIQQTPHLFPETSAVCSVPNGVRHEEIIAD